MTKIMWDDIEWWAEKDFSPVFYVNETPIDRTDEDGHPIVLCDFCNERITTFPVPVVSGSALCRNCFERIINED